MTAPPPRIELFVRSLAPSEGREGQERAIELLDALDERDRIAGFELVVSGDCVCPSLRAARTAPGRRLLGRYREFERWAAERDRTLVGFERREVDSALRAEPVTGISFPRLALAEYRGDALAFVAPSRTEGSVATVLERLREY